MYMKKTIQLLALLALVNAVQAQDRAVPQGKNSVNVYYGYNIFTSFYKSVASQAAIDLKVKSLGPVGLVYEHMVTDVVGLGVELGYTNVSLAYAEDYTNFDNNGNLVVERVDYTWSFKTVRAMFRANFHFVDDEKLDAYAFVSAGYRNTTFDFTASDPQYSGTVSFNSPIFVGVKPGIAIRYFFTPAIGIHAEFALGTPIIGGGLSVKF
jgi:hypothetical protein